MTETDRKRDNGARAVPFAPTPADFEKARDAFAPAFALGMQQAMASPARWADLSRAFLSMAPDREKAAGEPFLDAIFGATGLREAVLRQAATATGLAMPMLAELMPKLAAVGVEAMMRNAMGAGAGTAPIPGRLPADDLGHLTAEMMRRGANAVEALSRPSNAPPATPAASAAAPFSPTFFFDAFAQAMRSVTGGPVGAVPFAPMGPYQPFALLFDAFAKGMGSAAPPAPRAPPPPPPVAPDPDLLGAFATGGRRLQDQYVREMAALFERFAPPGPRAG